MQTRVIGSMATFPAREKTLTDVLDKLSPQMDMIYIYLNEYKYIPSSLEAYENVYPILGVDSYGDLNANGKMIYLEYEKEDCYVFTLDDDIIFPDDYVSKMVGIMKSMNNKIAVTVHGSIIPDDASWYYERTNVFGARKSLDYHTAVNLIGSGTFAYYSKMIPLNFTNFTNEVFVDLQLSLEALKNKIPLISVERDADWIVFIKYEGLWEQFKSELTHHTRILQTNTAWRLFNVKDVWKHFLLSETNNIQEYTDIHNLDKDFCNNIMTNRVPVLWRGGRVSTMKSLAFAKEFITKI